MWRTLLVVLAVLLAAAPVAPAQTTSPSDPGRRPKKSKQTAPKKEHAGDGHAALAMRAWRAQPIHHEQNGVYPGYGGFGYLNSEDYLYLETGEQYYNDGPNGPGYYDQSRWYNWYIATQRSDQLRHANRLGIGRGLVEFRAGRYDRAAIAWVGASKRDEGDSASRIHAGHALFAVGRYDTAVELLARAFELSPRLATSSYDIRSDYLDPADFYKHLTALKQYVAGHTDNADGLIMLGYVQYFTEGPASAYRILKRAASLRPKDTFIPKLLEVARMVSPLADVEKDTKDEPAGAESAEKKPSAVHKEPRIKKVRAD